MQEQLTFNLRDEFNRKSIAEKIYRLLNAEIEISPLVIDGGWGTGKTEFSHKLKHLIIESDSTNRVVYIDAFKSDHSDDPILMLTAAIASTLPPEQKNSFIKKAIPAIKFGAKTIAKAGAGWLLKQEADNIAEDFQDAFKSASDAAIDGTIENLLNLHIESEKNIQSLKNTLETISEKNKTIVIIDELDRCRPSFSLNIIETIKHIFDAKNIHFVLITNKTQLHASINHIYGASIDAQKYLDKFLKYTINLPEYHKPNGYESCSTSVSHWHNLSQSHDCLFVFNKSAHRYIEELITRTKLSLREIETLIRHFVIFQTTSDRAIQENTYYIYKLTAITGVFLHCFGGKKALSEFPSATSINEISDILKVTSLPLKTEMRNINSFVEIMFFGMIQEHMNKATKFNNGGVYDCEGLVQHLDRIESYHLDKTIIDEVKKTVNLLSFIE